MLEPHVVYIGFGVSEPHNKRGNISSQDFGRSYGIFPRVGYIPEHLRCDRHILADLSISQVLFLIGLTLKPLWERAVEIPTRTGDTITQTGLLYRYREGEHNVLILPTNRRAEVVSTAHTNAWAGHLGRKKPWTEFRRDFSGRK